MKTFSSIKYLTVILLLTSCYLLMSSSVKISSPDKPLVFPIPQQLKIRSDVFHLDENISIIVPVNSSDYDLFFARFLVRELSDNYGIAVKIEELADIPKNKKVIVIGKYDNPLINKFCRENNIRINGENPGPEGYILEADKNRIIIGGSDDHGAFYGLQSLRQLINNSKGKSIQGVSIRDWPNYPFRAIRLYIPGPDNIPFFKRFLRDFMAFYKFNKVIIEVNCMRLDRHPEVNAGWIEFAKYMQYTRSNSTQGLRGESKNSTHHDAGDGLIVEKKDVKDIVEFAEENFIEVIPEIPSLTHAYYLLTRHPELAEYPNDIWPDTYCPSNPDSYKLMFDVYDEYIEVMKPEMIHIGHDEWWGAPLDICPHCKGKDFSELFAADINKIYNYLTDKNIKVAMWGDFLLESVRGKGPRKRTSSIGIPYQTPGGTRPEVVKKSIPKDILIFNWFYKDQNRDLELNDFGFKQVYGNFEPYISNWDERTKKINLMGVVPSAWASTNEYNFGKDLILDFLGSANYGWSTHILDLKELVPVVTDFMPSIRAKLKISLIPGNDGDPIEPIDISSHYNFSANTNLFDFNFNSLKKGIIESNGKIFNLAGPGKISEKSMIAVGVKGDGEMPLTSCVEGIPINEDVSSLIFLHACAIPSENQKAYFNIPSFFDSADLLGWYEVVYEDGFKVIIPVQYGLNIMEWNPGSEKRLQRREGDTGNPQNLYTYQADPVICSSGLTGPPVTFYMFEWVNPRFGKKIKEVNLNASLNYQATQTNYAKPSYKPMKSNAIILAGISKVKKREVYDPKTFINK